MEPNIKPAKGPPELLPFSIDRMVRAVEKVRDRLRRATAALEAASVPYAVVGGNAVAAWVSRVDESAARATQDVDIMIHRSDLEATKEALGQAGFLYRHAASVDFFLDGPSAKARDAVHVVFANEKVRPGEPASNPDLGETDDGGGYRILGLGSLVQIKLTAFRDKDRTHLRDLIDVGLIDESWCDRYPSPLGERLRHLIETPGG